LGNYSGVQRGIPVVTVELPNALRTPTNAEMAKMWRDLNFWMDKTLSAPVQQAQNTRGPAPLAR
jgi:hypothetical protein